MIDWREKVKAAHVMVSALCKPRGSHGSREWIMSIPARPEHDPDLVITFGLMAAEKHIKELEAQLAACAAGPWRFDVENAPKDVWLMGLYGTTWSRVKLSKTSGNWIWRGHTGPMKKTVCPDAFAVPNPPQEIASQSEIKS